MTSGHTGSNGARYGFLPVDQNSVQSQSVWLLPIHWRHMLQGHSILRLETTDRGDW